MIEPITFLGIGILCGGLIVWPLILRRTERLATRRLEASPVARKAIN